MRRRRTNVKRHKRTLNSGREITVRRHSRNILRRNNAIRLYAQKDLEERADIEEKFADEEGGRQLYLTDRERTLNYYGQAYLADIDNKEKQHNWDNALDITRKHYPIEDSHDRQRIEDMAEDFFGLFEKRKAPAKGERAKAVIEATTEPPVQFSTTSWKKMKGNIESDLEHSYSPEETFKTLKKLTAYADTIPKDKKDRKTKNIRKDIIQLQTVIEKKFDEQAARKQKHEEILATGTVAPSTTLVSPSMGRTGQEGRTVVSKTGEILQAKPVKTMEITTKEGRTYRVPVDTPQVMAKKPKLITSVKELRRFEQLGLVKRQDTDIEKIKKAEKLGVL